MNFSKSDIFIFLAAFISFFFSVTLWFTGNQLEGIYVGIWVPSILAFASFFKNSLTGRKDA